jgi:precorrin-4 C11-methyltransferase
MTAAANAAFIAVTRKGVAQAVLLRQRLRAGDLYRPAHYGPAVHAWEHAFHGALAKQVPELFRRYDQLVFFLATGAAVRLIAPCAVAKTSDPGVLAVDEAGQFVIPILSGHQGGANAFARTVAGCLGAMAVITTASDVITGLSLDLLEREFGWIPEPAERLKAAALALVNQEPTLLIQDIGGRGMWLKERSLPQNVTFATSADTGCGSAATSVIWITDRVPAELNGIELNQVLWFRPRTLVLGVGCERGLPLAALEEGLQRFLANEGFALSSIDTLATVTVKADEEAFLQLAGKHGWQTRFFTPAELAGVPDLPTPSAIVEQCIGTPGVAEPAALLASGADSLLVNKQVIASPRAPQRMTFALARHARFQASTTRGRVLFVGAGPGDPDLLTIKASRALSSADVVIYAGSLIPEAVLRGLPSTTVRHNSAYLTLEQVMDLTLTAVRAGKSVVRLHSGDTSLYSAIQEQIAILEEAGIEYEVIPGVSSFQAAAAALKSELTVPGIVQTVILTRGEGATPMPKQEALEELARHGATLCIFLSAKLGEDVQQQLLTAYPPDTPVAIVYRVTWPDEQIVISRLDQLAAELRGHAFERTTLILVGKAVGGRQNRSRLYDRNHGHIFRKRSREQKDLAT